MFIKNIDHKVKKQVKELGLRPKVKLIDLKNKRKRYFASPCVNKQGETVFLKMLISSRNEDAKRIKKEVRIEKTLNHNLKKYQGLQIIKDQITKKPYWFMREFLAGNIIGYHFDLYKEGKSDKTTTSMANILYDVQTTKTNLRLKSKGIKHYLGTMKIVKKKLKLKNDNNIDIQRIERFIKQGKQTLNKNNFLLCHGDFTLANFFINKNKLYLTDWELAHKGNIASDISRVWIQTYKYPAWRKKLVKKFITKLPKNKIKDFKKLFRIMVLVQAAQEYMGDRLKTDKKTKLKTSMLQTIEGAYKNFNQLINQ